MLPGERAAAYQRYGFACLRTQVPDAQQRVRGSPQRAQVTGIGHEVGACRVSIEEHGDAAGTIHPRAGIADRRIDDLHAIDRPVRSRYAAGHGDGPAMRAGWVAPLQVRLSREHRASGRMASQRGLDDVQRVERRYASLDNTAVKNAHFGLGHEPSLAVRRCSGRSAARCP
jgi:hypothetical protein